MRKIKSAKTKGQNWRPISKGYKSLANNTTKAPRKMDKEGYPDEFELERIEKWDVKDFPALLEYIEGLHIYKNYVTRHIIRTAWKPYNHILEWRFSTGGWSGNESLIYALLKNWHFKAMWYYSWRTGGHYVFHIDPRQVGFKLTRDYCNDHNVSRQWISKAKDRFEYFRLSPGKVFVRPISLLQSLPQIQQEQQPEATD